MTENEMITHQRFGLEVEFTGMTRKQAADIVAEVLFMEVTGPGSSPSVCVPLLRTPSMFLSS